jgi:hypothetical protein
MYCTLEHCLYCKVTNIEKRLTRMQTWFAIFDLSGDILYG